MHRALLPIALPLLFIACRSAGPEATSTSVIHGTVTYHERVTLPDHALVEVRLLDVTSGAARLIAETQFSANGRQVPLPFELQYVDAVIEPRREYAVAAFITASGELLFETPAAVPVSVPGDSDELELLLRPAP